MSVPKTIALVTVLVVAASPCAAESPAAQETRLLAVLQSTAPNAEKAASCRKLVLCGGKASIPALSALLGDEQLASWARIVLEAIPDPAVDDELRESVGRYQGRMLIGVINSIGARRDAKAVEVLAGKLKDADAEVVAAAAAALGRIGGAQPTKILLEFLPTSPVAAREEVAEALLLCAERMVAQGKNDEAIGIYDSVRKSDVAKQRGVEAIRGAILARKAAGIPLMIEQIQSEDNAFFHIGLCAAREIPGREATEALVVQLAKVSPARQPLLLFAIADRRDPKSLPAILAAIQNGPKEMMLTGLSVMEMIGDASCMPLLLQVSVEAEKEVATAAKAAMMKLPGAAVDADIITRLPHVSGKSRQVLIEVLGFRHSDATTAAVMPFLEDPDAGVRAATTNVMASLGGPKEIPALLRVLLKTQDVSERAALEKALTGSASRSGTACTAQILPLAENGDAGLRVIALRGLICCGGPEALNAVRTAVEDKDEIVQEEAVRTLTTWPNRWAGDANVAEPLLALVKSGRNQTHRILALRGYLQYLLVNRGIREEERLAMVMAVLPQVTRPDEKRLVCSVLGTVGTSPAMEQLVAFAADATIAEEACQAIIGLAERKDLKGVSKEDLRKALQTTFEKAKAGYLKKKAEDLLKAVK